MFQRGHLGVHKISKKISIFAWTLFWKWWLYYNYLSKYGLCRWAGGVTSNRRPKWRTGFLYIVVCVHNCYVWVGAYAADAYFKTQSQQQVQSTPLSDHPPTIKTDTTHLWSLRNPPIDYISTKIVFLHWSRRSNPVKKMSKRHYHIH